ncbi:hypothetical protein BJ912DRAFT_938578 [Pholiota molesta]|nr:hypothetical protein BJ912DRAFT_938578 [Pholiota molesta]
MDTSSENLASQPERTMSALFCDPTADITFLSSDHVVFKIHGTHVNSNSAGFAVAENMMIGADAAQLSEPSKTLEVLFQFIEPPPEARNYRQPSVLDMEFSLFFDVAEAAEKYVVYGAMNTFATRMQQLLPHHPLKILNHCAKHGYTSLADQAAEHSLSEPLHQVAAKLTAPGVLPRWLTYYKLWRDMASNAASRVEHEMQPYKCIALARIYALYLCQIHQRPASFRTLPELPTAGSSASALACTHAQCGSCLCRSLPAQCPWAAQLTTLHGRMPAFSAVSLYRGF